MTDPERGHTSGSVLRFLGQNLFNPSSVGVAQRSPTAFDLNPFGIRLLRFVNNLATNHRHHTMGFQDFRLGNLHDIG